VGFALVAHRETETETGLLAALGAGSLVLTPTQAEKRLGPGDVALARLDVLPTLEGVEPGLVELARLEERGTVVLNPAASLLAAHDKLLTARLLGGADIADPRTIHLGPLGLVGRLAPPLVLKPRFGSWGSDVVLCDSEGAFERTFAALRQKPWFARHGAIAQELVPPLGRDLRVLVAAERVVGAIERVAPAGEWRTNVALGANRRRVVPPPQARQLAMAAALVTGADLVGVDLLPDGRGGYVVLEVNGAVEFTTAYSLGSRNVFAAAAASLVRAASERLEAREPVALPAA
jgi:RimK family alpha-L-glutamate ligase